MSAGAILGGASIGAGVGVSSVALAPFNAANTFMGSAFFGYGMILGERYMYQADWPKIQARLEHGEKIENIIQEYTGVFTAVVMKEAKIIFDTVTREFIRIMQEALSGSLPVGPKIREDAPTIGDPRRPRSPGIPEPTPKPPTTPESIIKEAFEKTSIVSFSQLDITTQNKIQLIIRNIYLLQQGWQRVFHDKRASAQQANLIKIQVDKWRQIYLIKPYKNPTPRETIPNLHPIFKKYFDGWN